MTDAIKMAEIQRTNIEFERQRHLANWLIKSSAHMVKPGNSLQSTQNSTKNTIPLKNGTITQNPLFFFNSNQNQKSNGHSITSKSSVFLSQTNLPLQIITTQDGHKPKLRKFNSHDTSANMFSAVDFENARLARRNEIERQKYKVNSLSSGGDCSTNDSKGSKLSNDSLSSEPFPVNTFLERYTLPRVIRLKYDGRFNTIQSSSSNDSFLSDKKSTSDLNTSDTKQDDNGELLLLYRYIKNRKIYHGMNAKNSVSKKKGIKIPQEYQGYFSLLNDRGMPTATMYTTIMQLVRERVYKFVTIDNMAAYTEQSTDTFPTKSHYIKSTARAGQIFRLLAVFQDGGQDSNGMSCGVSSGNLGNIVNLSSQKDSNTGTATREKERGRYAQLLSENRQVFYVSLSVKGKFFEIEQNVPQLLQRTCSLGKPQTTNKINPDCIHQLKNIINSETEFPLNLKFVCGPNNCGANIPENLTITNVTTDNSLIVCSIEDVEVRSPLKLKQINLTSDMIVTKSCLGFENEQRMFANHNMQNLLKFCQYNIDSFLRLIETERIEYIHNHNQNTSNTNNTNGNSNGLKLLKPLNFTKFLHRDKLTSAHEKEDSIIFLSRNDLDNLEIQQQQKQLRQEEENCMKSLTTTNESSTISDKMKVFQTSTTTSKKKWFKNFKNTSNKTNSLSSLEFDIEAKRRSIDRYQDMSKLIQERFGDFPSDPITDNDISSRPSSEIGISVDERTNLTQKSLSLQDIIDTHKSSSDSIRHINKCLETPDLLQMENKRNSTDNILLTDESCDSSYSTPINNQQSFITQKLYNEFHVKTKNYSKSSSNLFNFSIPHKLTFNESQKNKDNDDYENDELNCENKKSLNIPLTTSQITNLTIEDDLPYSNVRDSLLITSELDRKQIKELPPIPVTPTENIYAEICTDPMSYINKTEITPIGSIRISISTNDHQVHQMDRITSRNFECDKISNIYNTIE